MLTGKTRYRLGWFGRLVLQVQYRTMLYPDIPAVEWRDAKVTDLAPLA